MCELIHVFVSMLHVEMNQVNGICGFYSFVFKKPTAFFFSFFLNWEMSDVIKVQEDLASGTVIKGGCFCSDPGFKEASPPTSPRAGRQQYASGWHCSQPPSGAHFHLPLFLLPPLSSSLASFPSTVACTPLLAHELQDGVNFRL